VARPDARRALARVGDASLARAVQKRSGARGAGVTRLGCCAGRLGGVLGAVQRERAGRREIGERRERVGREREEYRGGGDLEARERARGCSLGFWGIGPLVGRFSVGLVFFSFF
jgi:hypothetical protein